MGIQIRKKKLQLRVGFDIETKDDSNIAPSATSPSHSTAPSAYPTPSSAPEPSMFENFTFEDYKAANLNVDQQYDLIGKLRHEVPLVDRDEIDSLLLSDAAKQLEMCVFPMCKMMHVDPKAVKRMLDEQFRKAYGLEIEEIILERSTARHIVPVQHANTEDAGADTNAQEFSVGDYAQSAAAATASNEPAQKKAKMAQPSAAQNVVEEDSAVADTIARMLSTVGDHHTNRTEVSLPIERGNAEITPASANTAQKSIQTELPFTGVSAWEPTTRDAVSTPTHGSLGGKTKQAQLSSLKKEMQAYEAKRKRAKKGCLIVTLRAMAVVDKWAALTKSV